MGHVGVWSVMSFALVASIFAMMVILSLGLIAAIYLSEYASERMGGFLKPILQILAAMPTVIYGYFFFIFALPFLKKVFDIHTVNIFNTAAAGITVGILILPLFISTSFESLSAVPQMWREAAYVLGVTKLETTLKIVMPAALLGIGAAFIIAISRAMGETIIVVIAASAGISFESSESGVVLVLLVLLMALNAAAVLLRNRNNKWLPKPGQIGKKRARNRIAGRWE